MKINPGSIVLIGNALTIVTSAHWVSDLNEYEYHVADRRNIVFHDEMFVMSAN